MRIVIDYDPVTKYFDMRTESDLPITIDDWDSVIEGIARIFMRDTALKPKKEQKFIPYES
jgi:hypothetical protein